MYKIIGIDPSKNSTGMVELCNGKLKKFKIIKSKKKDNIDLELLDIKRNIIKFFSSKPDLIVLEGFAFGARGNAVFTLGMLSGILRSYFVENDYNLSIVQPSMLKKFVTGKGNAKKEIMILEAYKRWKVEFQNGVSDLVDAFCLAKLGWYAYCYKNNKKIKITNKQLEVLKKLFK